MNPTHGHLVAKLEFRHLQMLVALDEHRSVSKVAEHLNVSQPAVSKSLTALEAELHLELFKRTIRGMEPTAHGTTLIRHAREILAEMDLARAELDHIKEGRVTKVSMGILPAAASVLVPEFIRKMEAESVGTCISVQEGTTNNLLTKLRSGEIDFVIGNLTKAADSTDFETKFLYEDPVSTLVRNEHPLLKKKNITWDDITQFPLLLPPSKTVTRAAMDEFFAQHNLTLPRRHIDSFSSMTNVGILRGTDAIGFVSGAFARRFTEMKQLTRLPFELPSISVQVALMWIPTRERQDLMKRICNVFDDILLTQKL